MTRQPVKGAPVGPDPSWRSLYKAGGISAFLYIVLGIIVPGLLFLVASYNNDMDGKAILEFIAANKLWWIVIQTLTLGPGILAILVFVTLFIVLKHLNKSYAAVGTVVAVVCQILFLAYYPVLLGLVYLSDKYAAAAEAQQVMLGTAAESLLAQNNAFNPLYESVFAISILIISLVMLKGVFHKAVAWLGIATAAAAFIGLALWPVIGIAYLWWWILFLIWFVAVGWKLYRLGGVKSFS